MRITSKEHKKAANFVKNNPGNFICIPITKFSVLYYPSNNTWLSKQLPVGTMLYVQKVYKGTIYESNYYRDPVPPGSYIVIPGKQANGQILWLPTNSMIKYK